MSLSEPTWLDTARWEVRSWEGLTETLGILTVLYFPVVLFFNQVKFRPWLVRWYLSKLWCLRKQNNVHRFRWTIVALEIAAYILVTAMFILGCLALFYCSRELEWANFRSKPLALTFFYFYGMVLVVIFLFWRANQWSLGPHLRILKIGEVPLSFVKIENKLWASQAKKEYILSVFLKGFLVLAMVLSSLANLFTIPFGECENPQEPYAYIPCNESWIDFNRTVNYQNDGAWHVAGNWLLIQFNTIFVIAATFFADYYLHVGADLLVEVHARVAESLMRFGVATNAEENQASMNKAGVGTSKPSSKHASTKPQRPPSTTTTTTSSSSSALGSNARPVGHAMIEYVPRSGSKHHSSVNHKNDSKGSDALSRLEEESELDVQREIATEQNSEEDAIPSGLHEQPRRPAPDQEDSTSFLDRSVSTTQILTKFNSDIDCDFEEVVETTTTPYGVTSNPPNFVSSHPKQTAASSPLQRPKIAASSATSMDRVGVLFDTSNSELRQQQQAQGEVSHNRASAAPPFLSRRAKSDRFLKDKISRASRLLRKEVVKPLTGQLSSNDSDKWLNRDLSGDGQRRADKVQVTKLEDSEDDEVYDMWIRRSRMNREEGKRQDQESTGSLDRETSTVSSQQQGDTPMIEFQQKFIEDLVVSVSRRLKFWFRLFYFLSILFLFLHASLLYIFTKRTLPFFQVMGILMSDTALLLKFSPLTYQRSKLQAGRNYARVSRIPAWVVAVILLFARVMLISVPTDAWFLGQSCMFVITACFLVYLIVSDFDVTLSARAKLRRECSKCSKCKFPVKRFFSVFLRELILAVLLIYYATLTALLSSTSIADDMSLGVREKWDVPVIKILDDEIQQWRIGVFSILLVLNFCFAMLFYRFCKGAGRSSQRNNVRSVARRGRLATVEAAARSAESSSRADTRSFILALLCVVVVLGLGIFSAFYVSRDLFEKTRNFSIIGTVATLLPALLIGMYGHSLWVEEDFVFWKTPPPKPPDAVTRASKEGKLAMDVVLYLAAMKLERTRIHRRNVKLAVSCILVVLCLFIWGVTLFYEVEDFDLKLSIAYPSALLSLICGLLACQLWFNTLQSSTSLIALYGAHIFLIVLAYVMGLEEILSMSKSVGASFFDTVLLFLLLGPVFLLGGASLLMLRDDHFVMSYVVVLSIAMSVFVAIGLGVWIGVRFGVFAGILYYVVLSVVYMLAGLWVWWNSSKLDASRAGRPTAVATVVVAILISIFTALAIWDAVDADETILISNFADPLYGLSYLVVAYIILFFFWAIFIIRKSRALIRDSTKISPSASLFGVPVVAYRVENRGGELVLLNSIVVYVILLFLSVQGLGFIVSMTISPNAGVSISSVAMCSIEIIALQLSLQRLMQFRSNLLNLDNLEGLDVVFDYVLQESVRRCLQISQQAMMTQWLQDGRKRQKEAHGQQNIFEDGDGEDGDPEPDLMQDDLDQDDFDRHGMTQDDESIPESDSEGPSTWEEDFHTGFSRLGLKKISEAFRSDPDGRQTVDVVVDRDFAREQSSSSHINADLPGEKTRPAETVQEIRRVYRRVYSNDLEYQMYLRDSSRYETLFHVLFWMRSSQLMLQRRAMQRMGNKAHKAASRNIPTLEKQVSLGRSSKRFSERSKHELDDIFSHESELVGKVETNGVHLDISLETGSSETNSSEVNVEYNEGPTWTSHEKRSGFRAEEGIEDDDDDDDSDEEEEDDEEGLEETVDELPFSDVETRANILGNMGQSADYDARNSHRKSLARSMSKVRESLVEKSMQLRQLSSRFSSSQIEPHEMQREQDPSPLDRIMQRWLNLTDEMAEAKIKSILLAYVGTKKEWCDEDFPATNGSLFLDWDDDDEDLQDMDEEDIMGALWCRPHELFPDPIARATNRPLCMTSRSPFENARPLFDPKEVMQGGVGDCWLLSAISVVALDPELIKQVLPGHGVSKEGVYRVRLFLDGKWENILVDDRFPCSLEQSLLFNPDKPKDPLKVCDVSPLSLRENISAFKEGRQLRLPLPQYCRSRSGNVLWPLVIEKAFAKRFRCYEGLNGGHVHSALVDLTGGFSQVFSLQDDVELVVSGALWERLVDFKEQGALLAAGSPAMNETGTEELEDGALSTDANGIVHGHAYAILRVEEQVDYNGRHRLLQLRDPWGICRWHGPWSKYDKKRWTRRMQRRLDFEVDSYQFEVDGLRELEEKLGKLPSDRQSFGFESFKTLNGSSTSNENDGVFWISLEDFVSSFKWLYVCQLFNPSVWIQNAISDRWEGQSAGGPPNQPGARFNPQFSLQLKVPEDTRTTCGKFLQQDIKMVKLFISISNLQESFRDEHDVALGFGEDEEDAFEVPASDNAEEYDYAAKKSGRAYPFMSLLLLDLNGKRLECELLAKQVVASTGKYKDSRDLSFETRIPYTSDIVYTIFPSLFPKGQEGVFRINVNCEADFELRKLEL